MRFYVVCRQRLRSKRFPIHKSSNRRINAKCAVPLMLTYSVKLSSHQNCN
uniref:Uncharacterized protein n=1 Tax=Anguilla anguilla TaxID=7936 RepID=A0A0E9TGA2_ANGAN